VRPVLRVLRAVAALGASAWLVVPAVVGSPATAADQTVTVGSPSDNVYSPAKVTIDPGDVVTWRWGGGQGHTVTADTNSPTVWHKDTAVGPPVLALETTFTFSKPGTYTYHCKTHPGVMRGTVTVTGATTSPKPTRTPSKTSGPPPSSSAPASPSSSASPEVTPTGSATVVIPSGSLPPSGGVKQTQGPQPTFVSPTPRTTYLGTGGLTPQPATGRGKGLPVMVALLLIGGVGSAELRALLANAPDA
jgi:plastocyanin